MHPLLPGAHDEQASLQSAKLPASQKHAIVLPRLKKPTLDEAHLNSYRPISNLSFVLKLVERVVAKRYVEHGYVELNHLFPARQSAYRHHHSSETAVVSLVNDLIRAVDDGRVSALVLLDTVDHDCLLTVLHDRFAVTGPALDWFRSYLSERTQTFIVGGAESHTVSMDCSVPQGYVLGPLEFISYTVEVSEIFSRYAVNYHLFADNKQLSESDKVSDTSAIICHLSACVTDIATWGASRKLQLKKKKNLFPVGKYNIDT